MTGFSKIIVLFLIAGFIAGCQQHITVKKTKMTGINPVSYTDVTFRSGRDTVLVSTFDGKIYEVVRNHPGKKQVAHINDEIYDMAYDPGKEEIYAATLHSGIAVIDVRNGKTVRTLPLKTTWAHRLCYNPENGILATYDFKGNNYLWDTTKDFSTLDIPEQLKKLRPQYIADNGTVYFDGNGKITAWNSGTDTVEQTDVKGRLADVDDENNLLLTGGKEFAFYHSEQDSVYYRKAHPDWPIYLADRDTIVNVPLSLEINFALMTGESVYTCGLDKSLRKWDKRSGALAETFSSHRNTPSGMDMNTGKTQLVTVDLGGNIRFWDL